MSFALDSTGGIDSLDDSVNSRDSSPKAEGKPCTDSDMVPSTRPSLSPIRWSKDLAVPGSERKRKHSMMTSIKVNSASLDRMDPGLGESIRGPGSPNKRRKTDNTYPDANRLLSLPADMSKLPMEVWHHVFTFLPPVTLGMLLRVNKTFHFHLAPRDMEFLNRSAVYGLLKPLSSNSIWSASRKAFHPGIPRPLADMTELEMWKLIGGTSCQFCGKSVSGSLSESLPWESGPGANGVRIIWPFGVRTCGACLILRTEKEMDLMLSSLPTFLVPALSFALFTPKMHIIPSVIIRTGQTPPGLAMTKYYYKEHINLMRRKFEEVKALGSAAVEEWIKGLEDNGRDKIANASRWEQWEASGGLQALGQNGKSGSGSDSYRMSPIKSGYKTSSCVDSNSGSTTPSVNGNLVGGNGSPFSSSANLHGSRLPPRPSSPHTQQNYTLNNTNALQQPRTERSLRDVNEAKALRRVEIERRCLEMEPPLTASVLSHMDSFSAAIQIPHTFTDRDWEILKPRLLAQREVAERKEQERLKQSQLLQAKSEERRQHEAQLKEAKEMLDREWEDVQKPIRDRMALYADEIINENWRGGAAVTKDKCPKFAADVLMYVRNKFYSHIEDEDALARNSGKPIKVDPPNAPPTRKLILENMRWIFDTKIKPLTEQFQKELFLCNACENHSKFYGFEGVVQHYAAKHTNVLSLGSIVVHWRAEWPKKPPFHPHPSVAKAFFHGLQHSAVGQATGYTGQHGNSGMYIGPESSHRMPSDGPVYSHQSPGPYGPTPYGTPYPYAQGPYRPPSPNMSHYYPGSQAGYGYPPPQPGFPSSSYEQHIPPPMYGSPYLGHAYPVSYQSHDSPAAPSYPSHGYGHPQPAYVSSYHTPSRPSRRGVQPYQYNTSEQPFETYQNQLDEIARAAHEAWNGTAGIKDLPNSVRAYVLIFHVASTFKEEFFNEPTLALFSDGLNNHPQMKPMRNLDGLACRACVSKERDDNSHSGSPSCCDKKYSLPALVSHFQSMHLEWSKSCEAPQDKIEPPGPDWKVHMVDLPDPSVVASLNMDGAGMQLVLDAFPGIFQRPPRVRSGSHPGNRILTQNPKSRLGFREAKRHLRGQQLVNRNASLPISEGRQVDIKSANSSPTTRTLEGMAEDLPSSVDSPRNDAARPLERLREEEYDPHHPAFIESIHNSHSNMENQHLRGRSELEEASRESYPESSLTRDFDFAAARARPITRCSREQRLGDVNTHEPTPASIRGMPSKETDIRLGGKPTGDFGGHPHEYLNVPNYQADVYHRQHPIMSDYVEADTPKYIASEYKSGTDSRCSPLRKASEDGEVCEDGNRSRTDLAENALNSQEMSAADRFLSSFHPRQHSDVRQDDGSQLNPHIDDLSKSQWSETTQSNNQHWHHNGSPLEGLENTIRQTPSLSNTHRGWSKRNSPSAGNYRGIRSSGGSILRLYERSPEPSDTRSARHMAAYQESRRSHSRFDRYEAQRQGSLRPRSRSPSVRDAIQVDSAYYGESPRTQTLQNSTYSGQAHSYGRLEEPRQYSRVPQRGQHHLIDDPRFLGSTHDNSVEYVPLRIASRGTQDAGTYYVERRVQQELPKDYLYDVEYLPRPLRERPDEFYRTNVLSQHSKGPLDTIRRHSRFR